MIYKFRIVGIDCPMCAISLNSYLHQQWREYGKVRVDIFRHILVIDTWLSLSETEILLASLELKLHQKISFCYDLR